MEQEKIRNFVIISHIDHGKSTLADRFLELTGTVEAKKMHPQYLDTMDLEQERGITIEMQPVRMLYEHPTPNRRETERQTDAKLLPKSAFILNLIDTPGHIDFSYEVSRALAAVEGAVLLVDATKGIQAQTIFNLELAQKQGLTIIPAVNKIDLPQARIKETRKELANLLKISEEEIFLISAKTGKNTKELLEAVIKKVPSPKVSLEKPLRALIFDSKYDPFNGVIAYVRIVDGFIRPGDKILLLAANAFSKTKALGVFKPELTITDKLGAGEIGYIATGIKEPGKVMAGDTIVHASSGESFSRFRDKASGEAVSGRQAYNVQPLPGYKKPKPKIFASIYPQKADDFKFLQESLQKLKLSDSSLYFKPQSYEVLGRGFLCGFLGSLHAEIVLERLRREFGLNLIISSPYVPYKVIADGGKEIVVVSPVDWPSEANIRKVFEPWVELKIIAPTNFLGRISDLLNKKGARYIETQPFGEKRLILTYEMPLREMLSGFYDLLLGNSQGFASMNYKEIGFREGDLVKLEIFIAHKKEEAFSMIIPREKAYPEGRTLVQRLKKILPPQLFSVPLQAAVCGKIIARETTKARRKDVTASLYGGDFSRKKKLLDKQKKGKKRLEKLGKVIIPPDVFLKMFKGKD